VAGLLLATAVTATAQAVEPDQPADALVPPTSAADFTAGELDRVLEGGWRPAAERARDRWRHPKATLQFFGVRPDLSVIEITPGAGWYAAILAPLLADNGHYVAAEAQPGADAEAAREDSALRRRFAADPVHFGAAELRRFDPAAPVFGAPASADCVLTFRNVHNWIAAGTAPAMFHGFFAVLKPGGVLGVVDHRAAGTEAAADAGYLPVATVVALARAAGFELEAESEINANPRDTHRHPKGVWTLPPTFALGDTDRARYAAIGESDRMTLRFVKPAAQASTAP